MGAEPELRFTPGGKAVTDISLVTNDSRRGPDGSWVDGDPFWVRVVAWEQLAENVVNSVKTGDLLIVTGRIYTDEWEDKEGAKRTTVRIKANNIAVSLRFAEAKIQRIKRISAETPADTATATKDEPPF